MSIRSSSDVVDNNVGILKIRQNRSIKRYMVCRKIEISHIGLPGSFDALPNDVGSVPCVSRAILDDSTFTSCLSVPVQML